MTENDHIAANPAANHETVKDPNAAERPAKKKSPGAPYDVVPCTWILARLEWARVQGANAPLAIRQIEKEIERQAWRA